MSVNDTIISENRTYWTGRAAGYSEVNKEELSSDQRRKWRHAICSRIRAHFPDRPADKIRILEVGTGPGFFAILMAEAGYDVTAIDLTPEMLKEARQNAGSLSSRIHFMEMNAQDLDFPDARFDVILSRNLTWNLPEPETAYKEWMRVLTDGGIILNFDANWYSYLYDETAMEAYVRDREQTAACGLKDENVGENFDVMEDIARRIPLSCVRRPQWDKKILSSLGMQVAADEQIWQDVWSVQEKVNFASTPMFLVHAVKA